MATTGIGVIGLGRMGRVYANHVARQISNARLVAVADPLPTVAEKMAADLGNVKAYTDYHDLLGDADVQGVIIASPTSTHREVVIAAAECNKAIFCEKPTALSLAATDTMKHAIK